MACMLFANLYFLVLSFSHIDLVSFTSSHLSCKDFGSIALNNKEPLNSKYIYVYILSFACLVKTFETFKLCLNLALLHECTFDFYLAVSTAYGFLFYIIMSSHAFLENYNVPMLANLNIMSPCACECAFVVQRWTHTAPAMSFPATGSTEVRWHTECLAWFSFAFRRFSFLFSRFSFVFFLEFSILVILVCIYSGLSLLQTM